MRKAMTSKKNKDRAMRRKYLGVFSANHSRVFDEVSA